jgi:hypothetical protein
MTSWTPAIHPEQSMCLLVLAGALLGACASADRTLQ